MQAEEYWTTVGAKKDFEDPLYLEKLTSFISKEAKIIEYGCGYGRMLRILKSAGYENATGYDFAPSMIERGKAENPDLDLRLLAENGKIPVESASADLVLMSTVLCTMIDKNEQKALVREILRVLKQDGLFYLTDFLICSHPRYFDKYSRGLKEFGEWGMYTSNENLKIRHHTSAWIMELMAQLDIFWFEQFDFKTMNQNPARTFHMIAAKR